MRLIIDADVLRYQIGSICMEHPFIKGEKVPAHVDFINQCVHDVVTRAVEVCKADEFICALSGKGNFRHDVAKQQKYKGNRSDFHHPYHYDTVERYIKDTFPCITINGREADDYLGEELRKDPENTVVGTRDKDIDGVEGWHYRWACGADQPERLPRYITREEALRFFFYQMLIGDNTDNILGCGIKRYVYWGKTRITCLNGEVVDVPVVKYRRSGVGQTKAHKLLDGVKDIKEMYEIIKKEYIKLYPDTWEEVMLENARLLYIGQQPDNLFQWDWVKELREVDNG